MFIPMEVETSESRFFSDENSEYDKIVKLIQSNRADAADLIFEELKKSIKRKGRWMHEDRVWPHENGKVDKIEKNKRKLKIVDNQELYTRFVPVANPDDVKSPVKDIKKEKSDESIESVKDDDKPENKRLTQSNRNELKKDDQKEQTLKKIKTEPSSKSKDECSTKTEKSSSKSSDESNGKAEKYPAGSLMDDDVELLLSLSNGDQDEVEPKMLRKRKDAKKENPSLHRISNGGVQKKKASSSSAPINLSKSGKGAEPLFNLKENMKTHDGGKIFPFFYHSVVVTKTSNILGQNVLYFYSEIDFFFVESLDSGKVRQKMFYGSTQVTRRDKPRREGTLADDSKKRLEAKLKKVKAKLKKST